ncbi:MAG TPA: IPT/TIG domain-containing protein [Thermoanaerobaculia bacterium]|jgi:plastocyanin
MRKLMLLLASLALCLNASAQEHRATPHEELVQKYRELFHTGAMKLATTPAPAPENFNATAARVFNVTAEHFDFGFTPGPFVVNQGDSVTLNIRSLDDLHGFLMETYVENGVNLPQGQNVTVQFVAHTAGTFTFLCNNFCGTGHFTMNGQFRVNAVQVIEPSIDAVAPAEGAVVGGTAITITGTNFEQGATVTIGGRAATNVNVVSGTTITATTPAGPFDITDRQAFEVVVRNPDGKTAARANGFSYVRAALAVASVSPNTGIAAGGGLVTITGAGFSGGLPATVTFGGTAGTNVQFVSPTAITVVTPAHALGAVDVVVTVGGQSVTSAGGFTYQVVPPRRRVVRK